MTDGHTQRLESALAGRYRIQKRLGEGGMATVYLAEDIKHERKVALKILKPELAAVIGAERFLAEIKTTANLQHPHILPLFDSGEADSFLYYVMPYLDGETLRDRLEREGQLGVDEAVRIARDVADALDYAHRNGIIHRDIKPANILLHDGRPVVADFGIALAISAAGGGRMTETGLSLGTPHYMSPEQASADRDLSARSDVYSLGCVLYEMLAGQPPHTGPSAQSILVRILTEDPRDVTELRRTVPAHVAAAVMKAIEKLPADRFDTARSFMGALQDPGFSHTVAPRAPKTAGGARAGAPSASWFSDTRSRIALGAVAVLAVVAVQALLTRGAGAPVGQIPVRASVLLETEQGGQWNWWTTRISPDGSRIAFNTREGIMVRHLSQPGFRLLAGTEGVVFGQGVTFSPDGEWLAYVSGDNLYKISSSGSSPITLVRQSGIVVEHPHWGADGTIVFASQGSLWRVSDAGGAPTLVKEWSADVDIREPSLLPDGSGALITGRPLRVQLLDFSTGEVTTLAEEGVDPLYVPTGHVLYGHPSGGLFALPFDLAKKRATGPPVPVLDEVGVFGARAFFDVAANGTLLFASGAASSLESSLVLVDAEGQTVPLDMQPMALTGSRFSPDGRRIVFNSGGGVRSDDRQVFVYDLDNDALRQLSFDGGHRPVFSPDGTLVVYSSEGEGTDAEDLWIHSADGASAPRHLVAMPNDQHAEAWPADSMLVFEHGAELWVVDPTDEDAEPRPYVQGSYIQGAPDVSPDGRYAAFESNEFGVPEVFVREFPEPRGKWRITQGGGGVPKWSADGRALYHRAPDGVSIYRTELQQGAAPTPLRSELAWRIPGLVAWDLDRNTGRLLAQVGEADTQALFDVFVVVNWFDELRRLTGGGR